MRSEPGLQKIKNGETCSPDAGLKVACFNARSLCNKTVGVLELLSDNCIDVCAITETWLKQNEAAKHAEIRDFGYDIISVPRKGKGGGVAIIFDPLRVRPIVNKTTYFSSFEVLECIVKTRSDIVRFCVIYRSTRMSSKLAYQQTRTALFFEQFESYLDNLLLKGGRPMIMGDFNFHVEDTNDLVALRFMNLCKSKGFKQHVRGPTHCAGGTLDLVLTTENTTDSLDIRNLEIDPDTGTASDHYLLTMSIPLSLLEVDGTVTEIVTYREFDKIDLEGFKMDILKELNMHCPSSLHDSTEYFFKMLTNLIEIHAPMKSLKVKKNKNPWWNQKCRDARNKRRRSERYFRKHRCDPVAAQNFKEARIDAAIVINQQRNNYYKTKLQRVAGNPRETYRVINHLLNKDYGKTKYPCGFEPEQTAEKFRNFFDEKVKRIYSSIAGDPSQTRCQSQVPVPRHSENAPVLDSFHPVDNDELLKIIKELSNKQCKSDPIPMFLFKECSNELLPLVSLIVNQSLKSGCFPSVLKTALVTPILKKPELDAEILNNYRPISSLSYISKIIEKCVHRQLINYLERHSLLNEFQSGYRKNFSCETAVTRIHNDILLMMDSRTNVVLMLLDLSAAFDTINHDLLIEKLWKFYGLNGSVLEWFRSYLWERKYRVKIGDKLSKECFLDIGVPQGSILGPLLFIMYTKDLDSITSKHNVNVHFYADDTQIYASFNVHSENPDISQLTECFKDIKDWMSRNYLKLNEEKTEIVEIGPYLNHFQTVKLGNTDVAVVEKAKNLGFIFDDSFSLNDHLNLISRKCNMALRDLRRIGSKLSLELKIQLVHSCILAHLDYCNATLSSLSVSQLNILQKLQNSAVRFIYNLKRRDRIKPYMKQLHFLPVRDRISYKLALLTFKAIHGIAPSYLTELINLKNPNKVYGLRTNDNPYMLKYHKPYNLKATSGAFAYKAPIIWNSLPVTLRLETDVKKFKVLLKTHLFEQSFKDIPDITDLH